jgi:DNA-3-methyladenine glycosylase
LKPKLGPNFFNKSVAELAQDLLGCELVHQTPEGITAGIIVEAEAYHQDDEASHSYRGNTNRTRVMFGPPGYAYVYFTYGMHWCFNITSEGIGVGAAVLIRALHPTQGIELMKIRRGRDKVYDLCSGPSRLVQAMGITRSGYGKPVFESKFQLNPRAEAANLDIRSGPRIGISKAQDKPWRFWIEGNPFISR